MTLKPWHCIILIVAAYALGAMFPGPFAMVKAKISAL